MVCHGSVLAPILFILYINDLAFTHSQIRKFIYADVAVSKHIHSMKLSLF